MTYESGFDVAAAINALSRRIAMRGVPRDDILTCLLAVAAEESIKAAGVAATAKWLRDSADIIEKRGAPPVPH